MKSTRRAGQAGFTVVEIVVAMALFGIVAAAVSPLLVISLRSSSTAKLNTQAKNLLQLRIDAMRNMPFHVAQSAGPYIDLLDSYFRDATGTNANSKCTSVSYGSASATYTCNRSTTDLPGFTEKIEAQFVNQNRGVVTPPLGYDSQSTSGGDVPPASTLAVRVTVNWTQSGAAKSFTAETALSSSDTGAPQIVGKVRSTGLSVDTAADDLVIPTTARVELGTVNADTGLSTGATARASVLGASTSYSSGEKSTGQAAGYLDAPPDQPAFPPSSGSVSTGVPCDSGFACVGQTRVTGVVGAANSGLPLFATASAPAVASVTGAGSLLGGAAWVSGVPTFGTQATLVRLRLQTALSAISPGNPTRILTLPSGSSNNGHIASCTANGTAAGNVDYVTTTGSLGSTDGTSHSVVGCTTAASREVDLFPTFTPDGVTVPGSGLLRLHLDYAGVQCTSGVGGASVDANFRARLSYWSQAANNYVPVTAIVKGQTIDPLSSGLLTRDTTTGGVQVGVDPSGQALWLGDYIKGWSSGSLVSNAAGATAQGELKVLSITTQPVRDADTVGASSLRIVLGSLACFAQDNR